MSWCELGIRRRLAWGGRSVEQDPQDVGQGERLAYGELMLLDAAFDGDGEPQDLALTVIIKPGRPDPGTTGGCFYDRAGIDKSV